jgi:hypothetical protein
LFPDLNEYRIEKKLETKKIMVIKQEGKSCPAAEYLKKITTK